MRAHKQTIAFLTLLLVATLSAWLGSAVRVSIPSAPAPTSLPASPTTPPDRDIAPGMSVERTFGPLTLVIHVRRQLAQVDLDVRLHGRSLAQRTLTQETPTTILDLADGDAALRGSLVVQFAYPPGRSVLIGDFTVVTGPSSAPFRGEIVGWTSPTGLVLSHQTVWLTPELRAESDVLFDPGQAVLVRFLTGNQTITTLALSQDANSAVVNDSFAIGTVRIASGMRLQLQPATPTQEGQVYLSGTFASSNLPRVAYAGAIATWRYVLPPPSERSDQ